MDVDQVVLLGRMTLQEVVILAGPVLAVAIVVSLAVNIAQVLTSLQDMTVSTVARLMATGGALFFLMPWMWRHIATFTLSTFSDFRVYMK
jgi:flagellar biosynthetic protein FliQ